MYDKHQTHIPSGYSILHCIGEGMAEVEVPSNVWWGEADHKPALRTRICDLATLDTRGRRERKQGEVYTKLKRRRKRKRMEVRGEISGRCMRDIPHTLV